MKLHCDYQIERYNPSIDICIFTNLIVEGHILSLEERALLSNIDHPYLKIDKVIDNHNVDFPIEDLYLHEFFEIESLLEKAFRDLCKKEYLLSKKEEEYDTRDY